MSVIATLRARTTNLHDQVDAAFSDYRLDNEASYRCFLLAHAHALLPAEALLARQGGSLAWRPREALLANDLAVLGCSMPIPLPFIGGSHHSTACGVLYVLEGSRLGGRLLAGRVKTGFPSAYLSAFHQTGEWRAIRNAIEAQALTGDIDWLDEAVAGAQACFDLYLQAAAAASPALTERSLDRSS